MAASPRSPGYAGPPPGLGLQQERGKDSFQGSGEGLHWRAWLGPPRVFFRPPSPLILAQWRGEEALLELVALSLQPSPTRGLRGAPWTLLALQ